MRRFGRLLGQGFERFGFGLALDSGRFGHRSGRHLDEHRQLVRNSDEFRSRTDGLEPTTDIERTISAKARESKAILGPFACAEIERVPDADRSEQLQRGDPGQA